MFDATKLPPLSEAGPKIVSFVKAIPQQLNDFGAARDAVMKAVSPATAALMGKVASKTPFSVHAATFSSGFVLGAAAAAFATPMSGPELRAMIRRQIDAWWNQANDVDVPSPEDASQRASEAAVDISKKVTEIENAAKRATRAAASETVDAVETTADATRATIAKAAPDEPLKELSKDELYERAQAADIDGRSQMDKSELIDALESQLN